MEKTRNGKAVRDVTDAAVPACPACANAVHLRPQRRIIVQKAGQRRCRQSQHHRRSGGMVLHPFQHIEHLRDRRRIERILGVDVQRGNTSRKTPAGDSEPDRRSPGEAPSPACAAIPAARESDSPDASGIGGGGVDFCGEMRNPHGSGAAVFVSARPGPMTQTIQPGTPPEACHRAASMASLRSFHQPSKAIVAASARSDREVEKQSRSKVVIPLKFEQSAGHRYRARVRPNLSQWEFVMSTDATGKSRSRLPLLLLLLLLVIVAAGGWMWQWDVPVCV